MVVWPAAPDPAELSRRHSERPAFTADHTASTYAKQPIVAKRLASPDDIVRAGLQVSGPHYPGECLADFGRCRVVIRFINARSDGLAHMRVLSIKPVGVSMANSGEAGTLRPWTFVVFPGNKSQR